MGKDVVANRAINEPKPITHGERGAAHAELSVAQNPVPVDYASCIIRNVEHPVW